MKSEVQEVDRGLGDTIARIAHTLALDKLAERFAELAGQEDCGCGERQEELNKLFPYKSAKEEEKSSNNSQD